MNLTLTRLRENLGGLKNGVLFGGVALALSFLMRLGGIGVFSPEAAIERFFAIVPASIQEAGVSSLGEFAKYAGLLVAVGITLLVYGFFGVGFERISHKLSIVQNRFEKGLVYSLLPFLFFGLIVFPFSNVGFFGLSSEPGLWATVLNSVLSNLVFGAFLGAEFFPSSESRVKLVSSSASTKTTGPVIGGSDSAASSAPKFSAGRRIFLEKVVIGITSIAAISISLDRLLTNSTAPLTSSPNQTGEIFLDNSKGVPQIFFDPRLADLLNGEVTPVSKFYYVSKNLFDPQVDLSNWSLDINGDVSNSIRLTYNDITGMASVDQYTTFECVSNQVNGNLISNALWTGIPLASLLQRAQIGSNAKYVVFYSADGYSVAIPLSKAMESDSMLAYKINHEVLPVPHGFPLRAVIPGLYGMMSAKWITQIQLVDSPYTDGYWQTRGWTDVATINTLAFITVPGGATTVSRVSDGSIIIGGVAFAGIRGISKVEVSVDNGKSWQGAVLKPSISNKTWTLWAFKLYPNPGGLTVIARATDGSGTLESSLYSPPFPNGAKGYASEFFTVN